MASNPADITGRALLLRMIWRQALALSLLVSMAMVVVGDGAWGQAERGKIERLPPIAEGTAEVPTGGEAGNLASEQSATTRLWDFQGGDLTGPGNGTAGTCGYVDQNGNLIATGYANGCHNTQYGNFQFYADWTLSCPRGDPSEAQISFELAVACSPPFFGGVCNIEPGVSLKCFPVSENGQTTYECTVEITNSNAPVISFEIKPGQTFLWLRRCGSQSVALLKDTLANVGQGGTLGLNENDDAGIPGLEPTSPAGPHLGVTIPFGPNYTASDLFRNILPGLSNPGRQR